MKTSSSLFSAAGGALFLFLVGPAVAVGDCGCSSCTSSVLNKDADGYSVRSRIDWTVANMGQSEQDACSIGKIVLLFCINCAIGVVIICILILFSYSKHHVLSSEVCGNEFPNVCGGHCDPIQCGGVGG